MFLLFLPAGTVHLSQKFGETTIAFSETKRTDSCKHQTKLLIPLSTFPPPPLNFYPIYIIILAFRYRAIGITMEYYNNLLIMAIKSMNIHKIIPSARPFVFQKKSQRLNRSYSFRCASKDKITSFQSKDLADLHDESRHVKYHVLPNKPRTVSGPEFVSAGSFVGFRRSHFSRRNWIVFQTGASYSFKECEIASFIIGGPIIGGPIIGGPWKFVERRLELNNKKIMFSVVQRVFKVHQWLTILYTYHKSYTARLNDLFKQSSSNKTKWVKMNHRKQQDELSRWTIKMSDIWT